MFLIVLHALCIYAVNAQTFSLPASAPSTAPTVRSNFLGYRYELATWARFALDVYNQTNELSSNLWAVVANRTGGGLNVDLGGNNTDFALYEPGLSTYVQPSITRNGAETLNGLKVGPSLFELCTRFDNLNASFVIQLPIAHINETATITWAEASAEIIGMQRIEAFQIGDEPENYDGPSPDYLSKPDNQSYVEIYQNTTGPLARALNLANGTRIFQAPDVGMVYPPQYGGSLLAPQEEFSLGLDSAGMLKQYSKHLYPLNASGPADLPLLLNHSFTQECIDPYKPWISFLDSASSNGPIPFLFSQLAIELTNEDGIQDVFGAALWLIDALIYSMSIGVSRVYISEVFTGKGVLWLPQESDGVPTQVYPQFYGWLLVADFIGSSNATQVSLVQASDSLVAYAAYEDNVPKRLALLNLELWGGYDTNSTTGMYDHGTAGNGTRPSTTFDITVPNSVTTASVYYLTAQDGAYTGVIQMAYGGYRWTAPSMGLPIPGPLQNDTITLQVTNGQLSVPMNASQAALVVFDDVLVM